jgi:hypothetical protein
MSKRTECDQCRKVGEERGHAPGWIFVHMEVARKPDDPEDLEGYTRFLDFCSLECLAIWATHEVFGEQRELKEQAT